jgi:hypothetical protein
MFELKHLKSNKLIHVVEMMNEIGTQIDQYIHQETYIEALQLTLELRELTYSHFKNQHIYRGLVASRAGFLYYVMGLWKESKQELLRAQRIFHDYKIKNNSDDYQLDLFEVNHILYKLAKTEHNREEIIRYGQVLLEDESLNFRLECRVRLSLAKHHLFSKEKNLDLAYGIAQDVKSLLETNNQIDGEEYADVLFILAHYHSEVDNQIMAMKFVNELNGLISEDKISYSKAYRLKRSTEHLKKVINQEEKKMNDVNPEEIIEFLILDDDHVN